MKKATVNDYFRHHWVKLMLFALFTAAVSFFAPLKKLPAQVAHRLQEQAGGAGLYGAGVPHHLHQLVFRTAEPPLLYKTRLRRRGAGAGTGHGAGAAPPGVPISAGGRRSLSLPVDHRPAHPLRRLLYVPLQHRVLGRHHALCAGDVPLHQPGDAGGHPACDRAAAGPAPQDE